jgi:hypothetical protein
VYNALFQLPISQQKYCFNPCTFNLKIVNILTPTTLELASPDYFRISKLQNTFYVKCICFNLEQLHVGLCSVLQQINLTGVQLG